MKEEEEQEGCGEKEENEKCHGRKEGRLRDRLGKERIHVMVNCATYAL